MNALGLDTAGVNGQAHWEIAKAKGVRFAGIRASISWGYQDKWFPDSWINAKIQGIHRLAYHVLYPAQPFQSQADNFLRVVGNDWDDAFPVGDFELDHGCGKAQITDCICNWGNAVAKHAPKPIAYSRKSWIEEFTTQGSWRNLFDWWLAQFLLDQTVEDTRPSDLPIGVTKWLIHQDASHFPAWPGFTPDSLDLDLNRWNGDDAAVDKYFGVVATPPAPVPAPLTIEQRIDRIEANEMAHGWTV